LEEKPWRKVLMVLDAGNGEEFYQDVDSDNRPDPAPVAYWGTHSGNMYPPVVGADGNLYVPNAYNVRAGTGSIAQGRVYGWRIGTPYLIDVGSQGAMDEPQAISVGGNLMYRSVIADRVGSYTDLRPSTVTNRISTRNLWDYNNPVKSMASDYDQMWWGFDPIGTTGYPGISGNYGGNPLLGSVHNGKNGIYHEHGSVNPIVPYKGKVFSFRANAILAYGSGTVKGNTGLLRVNLKQDAITVPSANDLKVRLEAEINKIDVNGDGILDNLRPGYYIHGQPNSPGRSHFFSDYFNNPGDTLLALARAYPHLTAETQGKVRALLEREFTTYFNPNMYARRGWAEGQPREVMPVPEDLLTSLSNGQPSTWVGHGWGWSYPQHNFYTMFKYAEIFPEQTTTIYNLAKSKVQVPARIGTVTRPGDNLPVENVWEVNGYIAGYIGFLKLQEMAGMETQDTALRSSVQQELDRLLVKRASEFTKDTPWINPTDPENLPVSEGAYHYRAYNVARNFIYLVPELGDYLNQNALTKVIDAWNDYNYVAPYWFVSRYDAIHDEGNNTPLDTYYGLFQAKAYILKQPYEELVKYLDVPAFERGDLFYINNLVATIEASTTTNSSDISGDGSVGLTDAQILFNNWFNPSTLSADIYRDNRVNGIDFSYLKRDWKP
jgi:hypothetical protein